MKLFETQNELQIKFVIITVVADSSHVVLSVAVAAGARKDLLYSRFIGLKHRHCKTSAPFREGISRLVETKPIGYTE